jgi:hypothetical protein
MKKLLFYLFLYLATIGFYSCSSTQQFVLQTNRDYLQSQSTIINTGKLSKKVNQIVCLSILETKENDSVKVLASIPKSSEQENSNEKPDLISDLAPEKIALEDVLETKNKTLKSSESLTDYLKLLEKRHNKFSLRRYLGMGIKEMAFDFLIEVSKNNQLQKSDMFGSNNMSFGKILLVAFGMLLLFYLAIIIFFIIFFNK